MVIKSRCVVANVDIDFLASFFDHRNVSAYALTKILKMARRVFLVSTPRGHFSRKCYPQGRCRFAKCGRWLSGRIIMGKDKEKGHRCCKALIDLGLQGTSVTCVLIGQKTANRKYVTYEIEESLKKGNGLLESTLTTSRTSKVIPISGAETCPLRLENTVRLFMIGTRIHLAVGLRRLTEGRMKGHRKTFWKNLDVYSDDIGSKDDFGLNRTAKGRI